MSQTGVGLLLLVLVAPIWLTCAYRGWDRGEVRWGMMTFPRDMPFFYWGGMAMNSIGGMFALIMGWWLLFK